MRIVFFTDNLPFPLSEGGKVAQFYALRPMAAVHDVHLVTTKNSENLQEYIDSLQKAIPRLQIHVVDNTPAKQSVTLFDRIKIKLLWLLSKSLKKAAHEKIDLVSHKVFSDPVNLRSEKEISSIVHLIEGIKPDLVQVDFIDSADIILALSANIKTVLIAHDLRYQTVVQYANLQHRTAAFVQYLSNYVSVKEMAYLKRFDAVLTFSDVDTHRLLAKGIQSVFKSPFAIDTELPIPGNLDSFDQIVFIGSSQHSPNLDAMLWYAAEICADVKAATGLNTVVIGNWPAEVRKQFDQSKHLSFAGFVDDLPAFTQNSIMVVPLRLGSGIRTKILEGFVTGTPVVSTAVGIEGIGATAGEHFLEANECKEFVQQIKVLQQDMFKANDLRIAARKFVLENFSEASLAQRRTSIYEQILTGSS